jgi:hypothetical protein
MACGHRDPVACVAEGARNEPLTERALDGWVAAARHLAGVGCPAIVPGPVLLALRRRNAAVA